MTAILEREKAGLPKKASREPRIKVFGIGFHKTGTSSLARALQTLGYSVTGPNVQHDPNIGENIESVTRKLSYEFDAFQDNPWPIVYKMMDAMHPNSKYILTTRDPHSWIESQIRHFGDRTTPMRELIYGVGSPQGNEDIYMKRMLDHNAEVIEYFRDRPNDLLTIDITQQAEWEPICSFLQKPIPEIPFPHVNMAKDREAKEAGRGRGRTLKRILSLLPVSTWVRS